MAEIIDQQNTSGTIGIGFGDSGSGRDYLFQTFIPTLDNITAVAFYLQGGKPGAGLGYKIWIDAANASHQPTGAVGVGIGGQTEIPSATLVQDALTKYTLTTPVTGLTPGNRYCMVAAPWNMSTHVWASAYVDWRSSTANPYANGKRGHADGAFTTFGFPDASNADIQFQIYGMEPVTGPGKVVGPAIGSPMMYFDRIKKLWFRERPQILLPDFEKPRILVPGFSNGL